jgi:uncharacterized protein YfaS (alpha-2-macroglobulin family)
MGKCKLLLSVGLILLAILACSLPRISREPQAEVETQPAVTDPQGTPLPLPPPALIEVLPLPGEELPVDGTLILLFDQSMDQASVELATRTEPEIQVQLSWPDPSTLHIQPSVAYPRGQTFQVHIAEQAKSMAGLALLKPITLDVTTVGYLQVTQVLPEPGSQDVDPSTPITVVFNRPVVPLQSDADLPQPLIFDPQLPGQGKWIGTSIYLFQPEPGLPGGVTFNIQLDETLTDLGGAILEEPYTWSFTSSVPSVVSVEPAQDSPSIPIDQQIKLTFNQAMDETSFTEAFSLLLDGTAQSGSISWNSDHTEMIFTPDEELTYDGTYMVELGTDAQSVNGSSLANAIELSFSTVPLPAVLSSSPPSGGISQPSSGVDITFSSPMDQASLLESVELIPEVENMGIFWQSDENRLTIYGDFQPAVTYQLALQTSAVDPHGTPLEEPFNLTFTTTDLAPKVGFTRFSELISLTTTGEQRVEVHALNVTRLDAQLLSLSLSDTLQLLQSGLYDQDAQGELIRTWSIPVPVLNNVTQTLQVPLRAPSLPPGLYLFVIDTPDDDAPPLMKIILIRSVELVFKSTTGKAFVWAVDVEDGQSISDLPIRLLDEAGITIADGVTSLEGVAILDHPLPENPFARMFVISGEPGEEHFGLTANIWSGGIYPSAFGVNLDFVPPEFVTYLYTDRPIYRPGQTVHYRGIVRQTSEARYILPDLESIDVNIRDGTGDILRSEFAPLSDYGTFHNEYTLSEGAPAGVYSIDTEYGSVYFSVASYRKPEFIVLLEPSAAEVAEGETVQVQIRGEYFSGGPVPDAEVIWKVWSDGFYPSDLPRPMDWYESSSAPFEFPVFEPIMQGEGRTGPDGKLEISLPTALHDGRPTRLTIEATMTESSGLPVTGRGTVFIHPADIYIALIPERYNVRAGEPSVVHINATDWEGSPIPDQQIDIRVERLTWRQIVDDTGQLTWESDATLVNQAILETGEDGKILVSFVPEQGGTYRVTATGQDEAGRLAEGQITIWVSGHGAAIWRQPAAKRLVLVPDHEEYQPGDIARIFIPTPNDDPATALITIERGEILDYQVRQVSGVDNVVEIPIKELYAPNVYISVVLIYPSSEDTPASVSVGLLELSVNPKALSLQIALTGDRTSAEPGESILYSLKAVDAAGLPVQAEFSIALVDVAVLALSDPNSLTPFESFYGMQPLRVRTGASLAVSGEGEFVTALEDGIGGGGGEADRFEVREEFPDTAFWAGSIITGDDGRAEIELTLPDSLTTWRMDVRGVSFDTLVGDATIDLVVSKDLIIRPVTPRFFTAGDAAAVAAVVHNDTPEEMDIEAQLIATGADITSSPTVSGTIPAHSHERYEWRLVVQDVEDVDLTFRVSGGELEDASKPTVGSAQDGRIPVLRYSTPDTMGTAGLLDEEGVRIESINLPRLFDANQGHLSTSLEPSLGATIKTALDQLDSEAHLSTETVVSRLLPNLLIYLALQEHGIEDATLQVKLEHILNKSKQILNNRQGADGGWGWWSSSSSDTYLTAYALYALAEARAAGASVPERMFDGAVQYLLAGLSPPDMLQEPGSKDLQVFVLYSLAAAGIDDLATARQMASDRDALSMWARAILAQTLAMLNPNDEWIPALITDLNANAIRSATSAHWQDESLILGRSSNPVLSTAHATRALIALDPGNSLIPGAVHWLINARDSEGAWLSTHDTAWALLALGDWSRQQDLFQADYDYDLILNGLTLASGTAISDSSFKAIQLQLPLTDLLSDQPNRLAIRRGVGPGTLLYTAHLTVFRPVEEAPATSRGISVAREYFHFDGRCGAIANPCEPAESASVGDDILVRLTFVLPSDQYYFAAIDHYPAGVEPIDTLLLSTPDRQPPRPIFEEDLVKGDWGATPFTHVQFGDDHLSLFADYLPSGTHQFSYLLHATFYGEYLVVPLRAWAVYAPEVFGQNAGRVYTIQP